MYTAEKAINKVSNGVIFSPILAFIGFVKLLFAVFNNNSNKGFFEILGGSIESILLIVAGIVLYLHANKNLKDLKKEKFNLDEKSLTLIYENEETVYNIDNPINSIKYNLGKIEIKQFDNALRVINVEKYGIEYSKLQELKKEIIKLDKYFHELKT